MTIRSLAGAALAAAALAAGACGGGGDERLSKEEFIAQADAICRDANARIDELPEPTSLEEVAELASQAVAIQEGALEDLRALRPPEEDEATIDRALDLVERQVELGGEIQQAAEDGDQARIEELVQEIEQVNEEADQIANEYGLTECGSD